MLAGLGRRKGAEPPRRGNTKGDRQDGDAVRVAHLMGSRSGFVDYCSMPALQPFRPVTASDRRLKALKLRELVARSQFKHAVVALVGLDRWDSRMSSLTG